MLIRYNKLFMVYVVPQYVLYFSKGWTRMTFLTS